MVDLTLLATADPVDRHTHVIAEPAPGNATLALKAWLWASNRICLRGLFCQGTQTCTSENISDLSFPVRFA